MQLNANLQPSLNIVLYVSKIIIIFSKNVLLKYYCQINVPKINSESAEYNFNL